MRATTPSGIHVATDALVVRPVITGINCYVSFDSPDTQTGMVALAADATVRAAMRSSPRDRRRQTTPLVLEQPGPAHLPEVRGTAHRVVEPVAYVIGRMVAVRGPLRCLDDRRLAEHALEAATSRAGKQLVTSTRTKSVGPPVVVIASPFGVVAPLSVARATRSSAPTLALSRQADPTERGSCR